MNAPRTLSLALAAMLASGAALAAPQPGSAGPALVSGTVDAVFGRLIVVKTDAAGKVLVDLGRHGLQPPIAVGETLQVSGETGHDRIEARTLTRAGGGTVTLRGAPHRHRGNDD